MKIAFLTTALSLICAISWSSPIEKTIDTFDQLNAAGIRIETDHNDILGSVTSFKVVWNPIPKNQDTNFPPRLDLIQYAANDTGERKAADYKLQVRYRLMENGRCEAEFSISNTDLPTSALVFRLSQQMEYHLTLSDFQKMGKAPPPNNK